MTGFGDGTSGRIWRGSVHAGQSEIFLFKINRLGDFRKKYVRLSELLRRLSDKAWSDVIFLL